MELRHIKELMGVMSRTGTKRLMLKKEGFELELEQHGNEISVIRPGGDAGDDVLYRPNHLLPRSEMPLPHTAETHAAHATHATHHHRSIEVDIQEETAGVYVTSPMVGTFYGTPSPDDPPFVRVGDKIEKHTVVCIIEAMKVMNEVKAGVSGTVVEVLVESGQPVEFGSKLFKIT